MSNQENSPSDGDSPGTIGPVEQAFNYVWTRFGQNATAEAKHNSMLVWYLASMASYNMMTEAMRGGASVLVVVTAAMKKDIDQFMATDPQPVKPGDLGTGAQKH